MSYKLGMGELLVSAAASGPSTCQGPCTQKEERGEGLGSPCASLGYPRPLPDESTLNERIFKLLPC